MDKPFPIKLNPVPIISGVIEIKFNQNLPNDAVFGVLYPLLNADFPKLKKLPALQVPSDIRDHDPQFLNLPHYELYSDSGILKLLLGPRILAIVFNKVNNEYPGWSEYMEKEVQKIYTKVFASDITFEITRFGIRYTDFFPDNIFENTEFNISHKGTDLTLDEKIQIVRSFKDENFMHNIVVSNNALVNQSQKNILGSIIDIDSYIDNPTNFLADFKTYLTNGHNINKEQFFNILKKEFIDNKYSAEYDGG